MRAFPKDVSVQQHACWALANLAFLPENQAEAAEEGSVEEACKAMRRHKGEAPLLQMGAWALQNLMRDSEINHVQARAGRILAYHIVSSRILSYLPHFQSSG